MKVGNFSHILRLSHPPPKLHPEFPQLKTPMKTLHPSRQTSGRRHTELLSFRQCRRAVPILAGAILSLCVPVHAVTVTWDGDANAGNGATDGSGTWDTALLNWFDGVGDIAWPNTLLDAAIFGAGGTAGVVTLGVPITVGNINFEAVASGNYTLGSLTNPATETLTIANGGIITVRWTPKIGPEVKL